VLLHRRSAIRLFFLCSCHPSSHPPLLSLFISHSIRRIMSASSRVCGTCGVVGGDKYRCAHCKKFKYCSVPCFKEHQEKTCTAKPQPPQPSSTPSASTDPTPSSSSSSTAASTAAISSSSIAAASSTPVPPVSSSNSHTATPVTVTASTSTASTSTAHANAKTTPRVPKSLQELVHPCDLERLARSSSIIDALSSDALRRLLRRIDGGDAADGRPSVTALSGSSVATHNAAQVGGRMDPTDEQRLAALEKYRKLDPDFEQFIQNVLDIINREDEHEQNQPTKS